MEAMQPECCHPLAPGPQLFQLLWSLFSSKSPPGSDLTGTVRAWGASEACFRGAWKEAWRWPGGGTEKVELGDRSAVSSCVWVSGG